MIHIRRKISTYTIEVDLIDFHPKTFVIPSAIAALTIENTFETIGDKLKFEFTPDIDPDVVIRFMERIGINTSEVTTSNEEWERMESKIDVGSKVRITKDILDHHGLIRLGIDSIVVIDRIYTPHKNYPYATMINNSLIWFSDAERELINE